VETAASRLQQLPTGGRTPLAEGLLAAGELLRLQRLRDPNRRPLLLVVTDGRATAGDRPVERSRQAARLIARAGTATVVVDCEAGPVRLGLAGDLAVELGGRHLALAEVTGDRLSALVRCSAGSRSAVEPGFVPPRAVRSVA
jgi:magnesium chelatase subunit D